MRFILILFLLMLGTTATVRAEDPSVSYTQSDRDRSIRIEQRLDDLDKRFGDLDKRMDGLEGRMDGLEVSMDSRFNTLYIVFFTGIVGLVGFVLWDRRSMVKPLSQDQHTLSEREAKLEQVLREYAKTEPRLAEIMKQYALW